MFGRRSMARTNALWERDAHCDEKEENVARRPPPQDRSEVLFCPLARGQPATWSVRRIIFFCVVALSFYSAAFSCGTAKGDLQEIPARRPCRRRKSGFPLEKRYFLNLFWAGVPLDSTRLCFADLMRVFPSGSICAPSPLGCGVRVDVKVPVSLFIASPLWLPPLPSFLPEVLRLLDKMFWRRPCRSYRPWYFDSGVAVRRH
ncbi:hypothetical protein ECC02_009056 [Trypanosoma cruzi]|uniref:Uncharacterized protein n=1 Tax=Trypanosoma cruzi TaxID=5693 RepID=A0A7J6XU14_TRYCR|nr:hypothetical protein ECC02_009056 [Trypanosoma cruzi]